MELPLAVCGLSDTGLVRGRNEDTFVIADLRSGELTRPCVHTSVTASRDGVLLVVCDGMGGAAAGDIASRIAAETLTHKLVDTAEEVAKHPAASLEQAVIGANQAVRAEAASHPQQRGMGTTCTAALLLPSSMIVANVGDSRAYLLRDGRLEPLTRDQSLVSHLMASGAIAPEQAQHHPMRHVLLQAIGPSATIEPAVTELGIQPGDRILVCSDGLHAYVDHDVIEAALRGTGDVAAAAQRLVDLALATGGKDNVTVVIADCERRP
jgi:serine/threonine protein phosphatase PrpC